MGSAEVGGSGFATPTGAACPRVLRSDGSLEGFGDCTGCGFCLLLLAAAAETYSASSWLASGDLGQPSVDPLG